MIQQIVPVPIWVKVSAQTRHKIRELFNIKRSGGNIVEGNHLISDGTTQNDLMDLTLEKLQNFTKSNNDNIFIQFQMAVDIIEGRISPVGVFKCLTCGKEFSAKVALEGHKRSHNVKETNTQK